MIGRALYQSILIKQTNHICDCYVGQLAQGFLLVQGSTLATCDQPHGYICYALRWTLAKASQENVNRCCSLSKPSELLFVHPLRYKMAPISEMDAESDLVSLTAARLDFLYFTLYPPLGPSRTASSGCFPVSSQLQGRWLVVASMIS